MIEYPRWKLVLLGLVMVFGLVYSMPNLFPQDPAVQISANRGSTVDEALRERVQGVLEKGKLAFDRIELENQRLLVRLGDPEKQIAAADALRAELGDGYTVALNLASNVPSWLEAIGGNAMTLGLDLQGGVHFLMEVDQRATAQKQVERYVDDLRTLLRDKGIQYRSVTPGPEGISLTFRSEEYRDRAYTEISRDIPALELVDGPVSAESFGMLARIKPADAKLASDNAIQQNVATLRNRINALGVAEPIIQQQGSSRIVVQLPGVQDTAAAKKILGATATLEYRAVDMKNSVAEAAAGKVPPESRLYRDRQGQPVLLSKKLIVSGDQLTDAASGVDSRDGSPMVSVELNAVGARRMQDFTNNNVGNGMAVVFIERIPEIKVVDGKEVRTARIKEEVISVANVREPFGKRFQTSGLDSTQEASELALLLRAGSLAAPVDIVEERTIGPSQGQDNIERGMKATVVGFALVLIFMGIYYRVFGIVADIALIANTLLLTAILSIFSATLTMPGIAALLLTVGMAVDANVLICERIREELRAGNTPIAAIKAGYEKAWATIVDANVTHLISGIALFALGSGPIRGFALVLTLGILTSVFTAVTVSFAIVYLIYGRRRRLQTLSI
jgi:preprotein translocase subunit SecD